MYNFNSTFYTEFKCSWEIDLNQGWYEETNYTFVFSVEKYVRISVYIVCIYILFQCIYILSDKNHSKSNYKQKGNKKDFQIVKVFLFIKIYNFLNIETKFFFVFRRRRSSTRKVAGKLCCLGKYLLQKEILKNCRDLLWVRRRGSWAHRCTKLSVNNNARPSTSTLKLNVCILYIPCIHFNTTNAQVILTWLLYSFD